MCYSFCFLSVEGGIKLIALSWQLKATLCPDCFLLQTCSLLLHGLCISVLWCSKPSLVPAWHAALPSSCLLSTQHLLPGSSPCPPDLSPVLCRPQHPFELPQASQGSSCVALPQPQHNSLITQSVLPCPGKSGVNGLKKQTVMEILAQGVFFLINGHFILVLHFCHFSRAPFWALWIWLLSCVRIRVAPKLQKAGDSTHLGSATTKSYGPCFLLPMLKSF